MVRIGHAALQEQKRVCQHRLGFVLEGIAQTLDGDLCRDLAVVVPAHAIGNDHQQGIARVTIGDAVLVVVALALAAFLINREFHGVSFFLNLPTSAPSQERVSSTLGLAAGLEGASVSAFCSAKTLCGR